MFILAAASALAAAPPPNKAPAPVAVEATATVRIVSGVVLKFGSATNTGAPPPHDSVVTTDGKAHPARLIEFE